MLYHKKAPITTPGGKHELRTVAFLAAPCMPVLPQAPNGISKAEGRRWTPFQYAGLIARLSAVSVVSASELSGY